MKKTWNHQEELGTTKTKLEKRALRTTKTNFQPLKQNENEKHLGLSRQVQDHQDMRTHMKSILDHQDET
jgi:predicted  nucleic acid-binding Zn-ribbon protein